MRIATWNINSIRQRMENLCAWLKERQPDVVCLQETKITDDAFPRAPLEELGYNLAIHGQKTFNGVAILSKYPLEDVTLGLPGDPEDDHARFIEALVAHPGGAVRVASIYLPNGNPVASEKYPYKMKWMDRLHDYTCERLKLEEQLVLAGDYNVMPTDLDVYAPERWRDDALFRPEVRGRGTKPPPENRSGGKKLGRTPWKRPSPNARSCRTCCRAASACRTGSITFPPMRR